MKANNIEIGRCGSTYFVTAKVEAVPYQKRFKAEPTANEVKAAIESFEANYAGLNESNNKPLTAKQYDKVS
jgi:predicted protein tyrosine phosphatase